MRSKWRRTSRASGSTTSEVATPERARLIVNADDLGLALGVDRGIMEAHEAGAVTSASVIVNLPAFDDAARVAHCAPTLATGLHFNVLIGRPLTATPTLTDPRTGEFLPLAVLARRAALGRVSGREVFEECAAQLARLRSAGLRVTHVDSHRHAHALPGIWPAVARAAAEGGVRHVRVPVERTGRAAAKRLALAASWTFAARGVVTTAPIVRFAGVSLHGADRFADRLLAFLERLPVGTVTELMVHPGHDDAELAAIDQYRRHREIELEALCSPTVLDALRGVELTDFGRV